MSSFVDVLTTEKKISFRINKPYIKEKKIKGVSF